jgi:hypothetical protein
VILKVRSILEAYKYEEKYFIEFFTYVLRSLVIEINGATNILISELHVDIYTSYIVMTLSCFSLNVSGRKIHYGRYKIFSKGL